MVSLLAAMKWTVLKRTVHGKQLAMFIWQIIFSITAILLALLAAFASDVRVAGQLVTAIITIWALGWLLGPILYGTKDLVLRIDYFRSLPLRPKRFAAAFTAASAIGLSIPVTFLAFLSVTVYSARVEPWLTLVSIPLVLLQVLLIVLLAKSVGTFIKKYTKTHLSSFVSSLVTGAVLAFFATGWWALGTFSTILQYGLPEQWIHILRSLPTGWSLTIIDLLAQREWLNAGLLFCLMVAVVIALWFLWLAIFNKQLTKPRSSRTAVQGAIYPLRRWSRRPIGAVVQRELLTWWRDYTRSSFVFFALFYSLFVCLYPAQVGVLILLPFAGIFFAVTAAGATANAYGVDGSMLWQLITTPKAIKHDVRGRQIAWLLIVAPLAIAGVAAGLLYVDYTMPWWPMISGLLIAALGGGAGLAILMAVYYVVPLRDPHVRGEDSSDNGIEWGQFMLTTLGTFIITMVPVGVWWLGAHLSWQWLLWATLPVGLAVGILSYWLLGKLAIMHLHSSGAQILQRLIHGDIGVPAQKASAQPQSTKQMVLMYAQGAIGSVLLFPQGIVPTIFKLTGNNETKVWFLAMYLDGTWSWVVIGLMMLVGGFLWYRVLFKSNIRFTAS